MHFIDSSFLYLIQILMKFVHGGPIVPFHKDFSPSGKQLEHRKLAHEL